MGDDHMSGTYDGPNAVAMAQDVVAADLLARCTVLPVARGGPGGQHANKTATGVRLRHAGTGLETMCCEHREAAANRAGALRALRLAIACAVRCGADPAWLRGLVRGGRLACGPAAPSWPGAVAVLLDALAAHAGELKPAAAACGLSTSQLARALTADPPVRRAAEALRSAHGLSRLRM
jgi:hypothetical protein